MVAPVNLVASLIVRNELDRYLLDCLELLLGFCDEIRVWDDGSDDGTFDALHGMDRISVATDVGSRFYEHEGAARQRALDWTLEARPTHVLAIDGDELIEDGPELRSFVEASPGTDVFTLCMEEIWKATEDELWIRQDGGWKAHGVPILYRVVGSGAGLEIPQRALASGRVPASVARRHGRSQATGTSILHLGWANEGERARRHARYVEHDGGKFHAGSHLDSIMWPDERVELQRCSWSETVPAGLRRRVAERINRP